jgi:TonB family protein
VRHVVIGEGLNVKMVKTDFPPDLRGTATSSRIREMIRKRVRDRLPELEGVYADAIRRNPGLRGKLFVRFRIDSSGKVQSAEPADGSLSDTAFVNTVLAKVRRWTFESLAGRTVKVLYPFVFVLPS